jgi:UDP-N-acetylmuramoylalanine--D-glutamate ligase
MTILKIISDLLKKSFFIKILKSDFDFIIISPGIDFSKCRLSKYLKQNSSKIYTDLDVFYSFFSNDSVTITGTNGNLLLQNFYMMF